MDTTSNLITSLRNAELASLATTIVPDTKMNRAVLLVLKHSNIIEGFVESPEQKLEVTLLKLKIRHHYKRISKPSRRVYVGAKDIPLVRQGQGMVIISTSGGVISGREARKRSLGGELLCEVY